MLRTEGESSWKGESLKKRKKRSFEGRRGNFSLREECALRRGVEGRRGPLMKDGKARLKGKNERGLLGEGGEIVEDF